MARDIESASREISPESDLLRFNLFSMVKKQTFRFKTRSGSERFFFFRFAYEVRSDHWRQPYKNPQR